MSMCDSCIKEMEVRLSVGSALDKDASLSVLASSFFFKKKKNIKVFDHCNLPRVCSIQPWIKCARLLLCDFSELLCFKLLSLCVSRSSTSSVISSRRALMNLLFDF